MTKSTKESSGGNKLFLGYKNKINYSHNQKCLVKREAPEGTHVSSKRFHTVLVICGTTSQEKGEPETVPSYPYTSCLLFKPKLHHRAPKKDLRSPCSSSQCSHVESPFCVFHGYLFHQLVNWGEGAEPSWLGPPGSRLWPQQLLGHQQLKWLSWSQCCGVPVLFTFGCGSQWQNSCSFERPAILWDFDTR